MTIASEICRLFSLIPNYSTVAEGPHLYSPDALSEDMEYSIPEMFLVSALGSLSLTSAWKLTMKQKEQKATHKH